MTTPEAHPPDAAAAAPQAPMPAAPQPAPGGAPAPTATTTPSPDKTSKRTHFSLEEDRLLISLHATHGNKWSTIARSFPGRNALSVGNRWANTLAAYVRNPWTAAEDAKLARLYTSLGRKWREIAKEIDGRTSGECRYRWRCALDPERESEAEDADVLAEQAAEQAPVRRNTMQAGATGMGRRAAVRRNTMVAEAMTQRSSTDSPTQPSAGEQADAVHPRLEATGATEASHRVTPNPSARPPVPERLDVGQPSGRRPSLEGGTPSPPAPQPQQRPSSPFAEERAQSAATVLRAVDALNAAPAPSGDSTIASLLAWSRTEDDALAILREMHGTDWGAIAAALPRRTAEQVRFHWTTILDPSLTKNGWSAADDAKLRRLADRHADGWETVAEAMEGRSALHCRRRMETLRTEKLNEGPWSEEEDEELMRLFAEHSDEWGRIAEEMAGRNDMQCRGRWTHGITSKPAWTDAEDRQLLDLFRRYGDDWWRISDEMDGKDEVQCFVHAHALLGLPFPPRRGKENPQKKRGKRLARRATMPANTVQASTERRPWTPDEERQLAQLRRDHGDAWFAISRGLAGRSSEDCREHYLAFLARKWTPEEDANLSRLVSAHPGVWWKIVVRGRTTDECRARHAFLAAAAEEEEVVVVKESRATPKAKRTAKAAIKQNADRVRERRRRMSTGTEIDQARMVELASSRDLHQEYELSVLGNEIASQRGLLEENRGILLGQREEMMRLGLPIKEFPGENLLREGTGEGGERAAAEAIVELTGGEPKSERSSTPPGKAARTANGANGAAGGATVAQVPHHPAVAGAARGAPAAAGASARPARFIPAVEEEVLDSSDVFLQPNGAANGAAGGAARTPGGARRAVCHPALGLVAGGHPSLGRPNEEAADKPAADKEAGAEVDVGEEEEGVVNEVTDKDGDVIMQPPVAGAANEGAPNGEAGKVVDGGASGEEEVEAAVPDENEPEVDDGVRALEGVEELGVKTAEVDEDEEEEGGGTLGPKTCGRGLDDGGEAAEEEEEEDDDDVEVAGLQEPVAAKPTAEPEPKVSGPGAEEEEEENDAVGHGLKKNAPALDVEEDESMHTALDDESSRRKTNAGEIRAEHAEASAHAADEEAEAQWLRVDSLTGERQDGGIRAPADPSATAERPGRAGGVMYEEGEAGSDADGSVVIVILAGSGEDDDNATPGGGATEDIDDLLVQTAEVDASEKEASIEEAEMELLPEQADADAVMAMHPPDAGGTGDAGVQLPEPAQQNLATVNGLHEPGRSESESADDVLSASASIETAEIVAALGMDTSPGGTLRDDAGAMGPSEAEGDGEEEEPLTASDGGREESSLGANAGTHVDPAGYAAVAGVDMSASRVGHDLREAPVVEAEAPEAPEAEAVLPPPAAPVPPAPVERAPVKPAVTEVGPPRQARATRRSRRLPPRPPAPAPVPAPVPAAPVEHKTPEAGPPGESAKARKGRLAQWDAENAGGGWRSNGFADVERADARDRELKRRTKRERMLFDIENAEEHHRRTAEERGKRGRKRVRRG